MTPYVAFLRGINVNGINIKMADLKVAFEGLGFTGVRTVLASGNVLFEAPERGRDELKRGIEARLSEVFGYDAKVVLLERDAVRRIVEAWPFERGRAGWHAYAVLSPDPTALADLLGMQERLDPNVERVQPGDGVLFWEVRQGRTTDSAFGKELGRARYRATCTSRNLNTLDKLR